MTSDNNDDLTFIKATFKLALKCYEGEDWNEAIKWFKAVVERVPNYKNAASLLEDAQKQFTLAAWYEQGQIVMNTGDWETACTCFQNILEIDSGYKDAADLHKKAYKSIELPKLYPQASSQLNNQDWDNAIETLTAIRDLDPNYKDVNLLLRAAEKKRILDQQYQRALRRYENAVKTEREEDWREVATFLQEIADKEPDYKTVSSRLAHAKRRLEFYELYQRGKEYYAHQEWGQAVLFLNQAHDLDTDHLGLETMCAEAQEKLREQEAKKHQNMLALYESGIEYYRLGKWGEAIAYLQDASSIEPDYAGLSIKLADARKRLRRQHIIRIISGVVTIIFAIVVALFPNEFAAFGQNLIGFVGDTETPISTDISKTATAEANAKETAVAVSATAEANTTQTAEAAIAIEVVNGTATAEAALTATAEADATQAAIAAEVANDTATAEAALTATAEVESSVTNTPTRTSTPIPDAVVIGSNGLNLRTGPGTNYNIKGSLNSGDILHVQGRIADNTWIQVFTDNPGLGWVSADPDLVEINVDLNSVPIVTPSPPPPPTPLPTPSADAVVVASDGIALLKGPGVKDDQTFKYDFITTLPDGTALNNLRPVVDNDKWFKAAATLDSGNVITGYVNIDISEEELGKLPPIYEYGPHLIQPGKFETRSVEGFTEFVWEGISQPLEEHQWYSLILVRDDLTDGEACYHWQTKDTKVTFTPADYGCTPGAYHWGVGIATDLTEGENLGAAWRDDSERDERNPIGIGIPHPGGTPDSGGGGGGNGGGGTIGSDPK